MTAAGFRRIALALQDSVESAHHHHPDFRVGGRIFATLGYPDRHWGMVNLTPDQQSDRLQEYPGVFKPAPGKWGEQGSTMVRLDAIDEDALARRAASSSGRKSPAKRPRR